MLRRLLTPRWIMFTILVFAAAVAFLFLAWWQLERFESATGSWQNLGYTLQWPFFAAFAIYVWWRLLRDSVADQKASERRSEGSEPDAEGTQAERRAESSQPRASLGSGETPPGVETPPSSHHADRGQGVVGAQAAEARRGHGSADPGVASDADEDPELAAYNAYLAELNRRAREHERRTASRR
jgi:DNA-binding transcriptional regulator of glucitol operon